MKQTVRGFTLVELLIVIVVIAILAAISIVAYNGIQERARNSDRASAMSTIQKALELYYVEHGEYPSSVSCGSTAINSSWCTTADNSWETFQARLTDEFISELPRDPISTPGVSPLGAVGYNYAYLSHGLERCGSAPGQWYLLAYKREGSQVDNRADCSSGTLLSSYAGASEYLVTR